MRGVYTAEIEIAALSAAKTVLYLTSPSDQVTEILSASITNMATDTNEQLEAGLFNISSLGTPTATSVTPEKHEDGDAAAATTAAGDVSANEPTYASKAIDRQGFSNLAGYRFDPLPEERPIVKPSGSIGLQLLAAPSAAFKAAVQITFREIG